MMAQAVKPEVQSVISHSNNDDEDDDDPETDSSDDSRLRRVEQEVSVDEPVVALALAPSPAPVPIQGGENEVIRVSHVRSILVKDMEAKAPASPIPVPKGRFRGGNRKSITSNITSPADHANGDMSDAEISDCAPMNAIEKSPYEPSLNAEKGEKLFTDMKILLMETNNDDYRSVSPEATKIFGPTNAWCLVKANALIEKSGMVYSQEWVNGNIRGNMIGKIPNDLLILCLVAKRLIKASDLLLSGVTRDLEVSSIIKEGLKVWEMDKEYKRIVATQKNYPFTAKKRDCFKCAIFVARTYSCYKAFGIKNGLDEPMLTKVKTCLDYMEERLSDSLSQKKRKKSAEKVEKVEPMPVASAAAAAALPPVDPSPPNKKRKRGRPRKNANPASAPEPPVEPAKPEDADEIASQMSEESDFQPRAPASRPRKSSGSNVNSNANVNSNGSGNGKRKSSLAKLISKFQGQYEAMGEVYHQMGETLTELKQRSLDSRSATRDEIREELVQEMQQTLMNSFSSKK